MVGMSSDAIALAARELAELASYAEIVGGITVNRGQIRTACDDMFSALRGSEEAEANPNEEPHV